MRLIDADELKKAIINHLCVKSEDYLLPAEKSIYDLIDNQPTINMPKEEIKVGDEVASVNPATGELNLWNTFIVTEIGEDFIGGINSKGETHFHDEPGIFSIWAKTGKHIDILRAFEPVETASAKEGEQE